MTPVRLRHLAQINPSTPEFDSAPDEAEVTFVPLEAVWRQGVDTSRRRPKAEVAQGYTRFRDGDVLVPKITPTFEADRSTIAEGLSNGFGAGTTELHVVRCRPAIEPQFVRYLVSSRPFLLGGEAEMIGVAGQKRVPDSCLRDLLVSVTEVEEQRAIADFLDTETARIDALINKKRRMISLVELRASATADRLAFGLDHAEVVDSRSEFLTVVPRHWPQTTVRHLGCDVQTGPFGSQLHAEEYVVGGWPVVNPGNLKHGGIVPIAARTVSDEKRSELGRHVLREGDIVFGRRGEMGRAGLVESEHAGWLCGTGSLRLRLSERSPLDSSYLTLLLETSALRRYFELTSIGSTMDNLNSEIVLGMPCLVPPFGEQKSIVEEVRSVRSTSGSLIGRLTRQITLLQEHRQALITAAVTGELDIPGAA